VKFCNDGSENPIVSAANSRIGFVQRTSSPLTFIFGFPAHTYIFAHAGCSILLIKYGAPVSGKKKTMNYFFATDYTDASRTKFLLKSTQFAAKVFGFLKKNWRPPTPPRADERMMAYFSSSSASPFRRAKMSELVMPKIKITLSRLRQKSRNVIQLQAKQA